MRVDRRVPSFATTAAVRFALVPLAEPGLRHGPVALGCTDVVLSVRFLLDWLGRRSRALR